MNVTQIEPVSAERWDDLERLFGPNGAYSNCWCTWWTWTASEFDRRSGGERRAELHRQVVAGMEPGLLAYHGDEPIGWCAVAPRERYQRLMSPRARTFRALDARPSWVVSCFYVRRDVRRRGVAGALLDAATDFVGEQDASLVEGYPVEAVPGAAAAFTGTTGMFAAAGFSEVARFNNRPLVRLELPQRRRR